MKAIIIDDEPDAREVLQAMLADYVTQLTVVGTASNVPDAIKAINQHTPDLIFLDIKMPGQNGFRLLNYFDNPGFRIIFTTGYPEFALKAFEVSALDYLVKPIQISKLDRAVKKALSFGTPPLLNDRIDLFKKTLNLNRIHKIALPVLGKILFCRVEDILYLKASSAYTQVVTRKKSLLISKGITEFEYMLEEDERFFRVHRSYIVNIEYIQEYLKHDNGGIVMENEDYIPIARERKQDFDALVKGLLVGYHHPGKQ